MADPSNPYPPHVHFELARERNRIAADRSLLAWIRSSLIFISVGFGLERSLTALSVKLGVELDSMTLVKLVGTAFIGLGTFTIVMAALDYHQEMQRLRQDDYTYIPRRSLGMTSASFLLAIAVIAFIGIYWQALA